MPWAYVNTWEVAPDLSKLVFDPFHICSFSCMQQFESC